MSTNVIPTKLDVFNLGNKFSFDVNTPQFLKEACENVNGGMYAVCWNIFKYLLVQVAERAIELNDPILNTLMIRLNLYEIPNKERYKVIKQLHELYNKSVKHDSSKKERLREAFCKARCDGHPPRSTCMSLGTCKEYDNFVRLLNSE